MARNKVKRGGGVWVGLGGGEGGGEGEKALLACETFPYIFFSRPSVDLVRSGGRNCGEGGGGVRFFLCV